MTTLLREREAGRIAHDRRIEDVMALVVDGDGDALEALFDLATGPIRRMVVARLQDAGVWVDRDRLDDIVRSAVLELVRLAPAWRPDGGASPWGWAKPRLISLAFHELGQFADDLDDHRDLEDRPAPSGVGEPAIDVLVRAARRRSDLRVLASALDRVASRRDQAIWLEVLCESEAGNASPAVTVAREHEMTPAAVRKVCQRVRDRLAKLALTESTFESLRKIQPLAA